ncbi:MAG: type II secretion system protein [bacterium]
MINFFKKTIKTSGFSLTEVVVVIAIVGLAFVGLLETVLYDLKVSFKNQKTIQASFFAEETLESARSFRDNTDWDVDGMGALTTGAGNFYYPVIVPGATSSAWMLASGTDTVGIFTRWLIIDDVSRDQVMDDIESVYVLANDDPDTKKVTARVVSSSSEIILSTYLTNWR